MLAAVLDDAPTGVITMVVTPLSYAFLQTLHRFVCRADIHAKVGGHADAGTRLRPARQHWRQFAQRQRPGSKQTAPVPAVFEVIQLQPSTSTAHTCAYWREAVQVFLLREAVQTAQPRATAYQTAYR